MPKVCLQAGHQSITTGATGAPGERDWNSKIVPMIAEKLRWADVEVYETDAKGNTDNTVTTTDWNLFLAIHYDADIYNDRGGFYDYPDESIDQVYETSKKLATTLGEYYFDNTGIPLKLNRSNANTKFYYMWSALTAKTPCCILECGVGNRKPQDYEILRDYELISSTIAEGILLALGLSDTTEADLAECQAKCQELDEELDEMRESRDKWKQQAKDCEASSASKENAFNLQIESLQKSSSELTAQLTLVTRNYDQVSSEVSALKGEATKLEDENEKLTKEVAALKKSVEIKNLELSALKEKIQKGLKGYSKRELIVALFNRR